MKKNVVSANIAVILYKPKTLANGEHPLMLRITQNGKRKYYSLGKSCPENLWDFTKSRPKSSHPDSKVLKAIISKKIAEYESKIHDFTHEEKDFTPDTLINSIEKPQRKVSVLDFFDEVIERLAASKQIRNSLVYKDAKSCIVRCFGGRDFAFSEVDYSFLIKLETYLRKSGNSENSISNRFRTLRALLNKAIQEKVAKKEHYPFNEFKIGKFNTSTQKRAITKEDVKKIEGLAIEPDSLKYNARQYFLFSYYCIGISFVDIAHLKWENIIGNRIFYKRSKTKGEFSVMMPDEAKKIIEYWRPITGGGVQNYIFPILNRELHITPSQIHNRVVRNFVFYKRRNPDKVIKL